MSDPNAFAVLDSSLKPDAVRRVAEIAAADLLVGIPTYKNAHTLTPLLETISNGIRDFFPRLRAAIAVVDGGSSDETTAIASTYPLAPNIRRVVTTYLGIPGKGSAVRAIFEIARKLNVRVCLVMEADLANAAADWIPKLASPILDQNDDLVIPAYARPLVDGGISDLLAYPITRALYGSDVRTPMPGEFAIAGALAARLFARDVWETDVARHGLDIWLTTIAITENIRMSQTRLGAKLHDARQVASLADPSFVQAVGTLFRLMEVHRRRWQADGSLRAIPFHDNDAAPDPARLAGAITQEMLADAFQLGAKRYRRFWRTILVPTHYAQIFDLANRPNGAAHLPPDLWARAVFDFAVVYNKGETDPDKVAAALLPIYYARIATLVHETHSKTDAVEKALQFQAKTFAEQKPYLLHRWERYVPWMGEGVR